ncbi:MAG TPA: hypothetical protein VKG65_01650 [Terriglobales bacterium]|nr:hypothetical protein [Terriglobales bacterium]
MRLSIKALGITGALLWAAPPSCAAMQIWYVAPMAQNSCELSASIYPAFHASRTFTDVLVALVTHWLMVVWQRLDFWMALQLDRETSG